MNAIVTTLLALVQQLLPVITTSATVQNIVNALVAILPAIVQEAEDLVPVVKNIIAALSANPAATADQLATLQALDAQCDAAFDTAAAAAQAQDGTAPPAS